MDSLTQIALGATVGAVIGGKKYGRKSALIGAIFGTIPDLDSFLYLNSDPITSFTYHRGFSHSLLFAILATPIFAWLISKMKWLGMTFKDKQLHLIIFLCLLTHMLLDAFTVYGTQLLWPLNTPPVGLGSIFIIDPLYTIPLLIGLIWFLVNKSIKTTKVVLFLSTLYLLWGVIIQNYVISIVPKEKNQIILVQTSPFNTFLWRILVVEDDKYKVGYYSIFDKSKEIEFLKYPNQSDLASKNEKGQRLKWFTKGFYQGQEENNKIIISDIRMGLEPDDYVFSFIIQKNDAVVSERYKSEDNQSGRDLSRLKQVWNRIWDQNIQL